MERTEGPIAADCSRQAQKRPLLRAAVSMAFSIDYSAAMRTSGAAAITSGVTWVSNFWKFFWNMPTNAPAVLSKSALFFHVFIGCKRCGSTPGTEVGTANHKNGAWG